MESEVDLLKCFEVDATPAWDKGPQWQQGPLGYGSSSKEHF